MLSRICRVVAPVPAAVLLLAFAPVVAFSSGSDSHTHNHNKIIEVLPGAPAPTISLEAFTDPNDGYNLQLIVENFTFSPENTGQDTSKVEGHAHLYVNGVKLGRLYGTWTHLPAKLLAPGVNEVMVNLNTNTHQAWGVGGEPLKASIELNGPEAGEEPRDIMVHVGPANTGEAPVVEIGNGEQVRLHIHGAGSGKLHFHGYDLEVQAAEGHSVMVDLDATNSGRFPVMTHFHDAILGDQEKALFYLDIRTR